MDAIDPVLLSVGAAFLVMLTSLAGVIFLHKTARQFLEERLAYLVSFSAGVFLVTAGALALEALHLFASAWQALGAIALGYIAAWALHFVLPETHHHHDTACAHGHGGARRLIVGDAIHNIADGIILVPAFMVSPILGVTVAASILVHEFLQEVSEFFVLRQNGYTTRQALTINFAVSSTIMIGVVVGGLALATLAVEGLLLALSAGFFLHVVVHDLLPKRRVHRSGAQLTEHVLIVALGVVAMASVNVLLGDAHIHGGGEHAHEHGHEGEHEDAHEHAPDVGHEHADELRQVDESDHAHEHDHDDEHGAANAEQAGSATATEEEDHAHEHAHDAE
ncbi:MAG: ZIP family metal transporter [Patescibacteria group bacterium]